MQVESIDDLREAFALSERRRLDAQRLSGVGFWELDHKLEVLYWSEEIFAIYGLKANALEPNYEIFKSLIHDDDRDWVNDAYLTSVEQGTLYDIRYRIKSGPSFKWIEARGVTYYDGKGKPERSIGTAQDVSEIIQAQQANAYLAKHDVLTGLPNRTLFEEKITQALNLAKRYGLTLAVIFLDLDNFKSINDQHGHEIGDEVLRGVAKQLESCSRSTDSFARIGGDEFVGLVTVQTKAGVNHAISRIKKAVETIYPTKSGDFEVTASIGVTLYPEDYAEPDALVRHADHAMYAAKEAGASHVCFFDSNKHLSNISRYQLIEDIERALVAEEFSLHFQPKVSLVHGELVGAEVLLRWQREDGPFSPAKIIDAIKGTALEWELDQWVTGQFLSQASNFSGMTGSESFSLNFNSSSLQNTSLPERLVALLSGARPHNIKLEIEILEVSAIDRLEKSMEILMRCKELGFSLSLDDFGTGYSSLTYFHALPIDNLKIDQLFIKSLLTDDGSLALVKSILAIARENNCPVIAEGVETLGVAAKLSELGCDLVQGYYIAKPMPQEEFLAWAAQWNPQEFMDDMENAKRS